MIWFAVIAVGVAIALIGVVVHVDRALAEIRGYRRDWQELANTQLKHEIDIRYLREFVNPMARTGKAPLPKHLRQEKP